ncbi:MAG: hypothetical protein KC582_04865, partial [Candidatus Magasanikbacteria bacterium]|nr:hypothetical protein [Candidatus Magasanikbacteria bacterium]
MRDNPFKNIPPPIPSRGEISGLHRKADHEEEVEAVDFRDLVSEETSWQAGERRRRHLELVKESKKFDNRINDLLEQRWMEGQISSLDYQTRLHDLTILNDGNIVSTEIINGGANGTKLLFLTDPAIKKSNTNVAKVAVFEKAFGGEMAQIIDPATGDLLTIQNNFIPSSDGKMIRETSYRATENKHGPTALKKDKIYYKSREMFEEAYQAKYANFYQYDVDQYPIDRTAIGLRHTEVGKTLRREYVCAAIDVLFGLSTVPTTVLTTDGEELFSRQKGLLKTHVLSDPEAGTGRLISSIVQQEPHPAKKSLMRLAVLHDLAENTDGHLGNVLLDKPNKKGYQSLHGIDFGHSFPLHTQLKTGEVVSNDSIKSAAIQ